MNVRFFPLIALFILAGCSRMSPDRDRVDSSHWMMESLQRLPHQQPGWSLTGRGGGGSFEGGAYLYDLTVNGIPAVRAQRELRSLLTHQLEKDGYIVNGGGSGGDESFGIRAQSAAIRGSLSVSFYAETPTKIAVNIAIAQVWLKN
jgi:hypothetical protein